MAIICRSSGLLFIMAPRTGCSAVGDVLCNQLDGEFIPAESILDANNYVLVRKKHSTVPDLLKHQILTAEEAASLLKFTCVRNPFDSLVSLYTKIAKQYQPLLADRSSWIYQVPGYVEEMDFCRTHSFNEWVLKKYGNTFLKRLLGRGSKSSLYKQFTVGVDTIMRFESLQDDFQAVLKRAGVTTELSIPIYNRTPGRTSDYRKYYNEITQRVVKSVFYEELELLNYKF